MKCWTAGKRAGGARIELGEAFQRGLPMATVAHWVDLDEALEKEETLEKRRNRND